MRSQAFLCIFYQLLLNGCIVVSIKVRSPPFDRSGGSVGLFSRDLPTGTCNAQTPCPIAACCGTNGLCGYSPSECGAGKCLSKCDSKAECGQYGVPGKQNCPLNVCCSQFGYVVRLENIWIPLQTSTNVVFKILRVNR